MRPLLLRDLRLNSGSSTVRFCTLWTLALLLATQAFTLARAASPPPTPEAWQGRTVVVAGDVSPAIATSVTTFGRPVVVWADRQASAQLPPGPTVIRLSLGDGFGWRSVVMGVLGAGAHTQVDVATSGTTFVAYHDPGPDTAPSDDLIRVARMLGAAANAFAEPTLPLPASAEFDLMAPVNTTVHQAHLVFKDSLTANLRMQSRSSGGWSSRDIPTVGSDFRGLSLLDDAVPGSLNLFYSSVLGGERGLRHAHFDGSVWSTSTLVSQDVTDGVLRAARQGSRLGVLLGADAATGPSVQLMLRVQNGDWTQQTIESFAAGAGSATIVQLGSSANLAWSMLYGIPAPIKGSPRYRHARQQVTNTGGPFAEAELSDFGQTPGAAPIPVSDQGSLAAVLSEGYSAAIMQRPLHADLDYYRLIADWSRRTILNGDPGIRPEAGTALARDGRGRPQWLVATSDQVLQLRWEEGEVLSRVVASGIGLTRALDLEVGQDGIEHAVMQRINTSDLVYAFRLPSEEQWQVQTLDSAGDVGADAQIHVTREGVVFISYADLSMARAVVSVGKPGQSFVRLVDPASAPPLRAGRLRSSLWQGQLGDGTPVARVVAAFVIDQVPTDRVYTLEVEQIGSDPPRPSGRGIAIPVLNDSENLFRDMEPEIDVAMLTTAEYALAVVQRSAVGARRLRLLKSNSLDPAAANATPVAQMTPRSLSTSIRSLRIGLRNGSFAGARVLVRGAGVSIDPLMLVSTDAQAQDLSFGEVLANSGPVVLDTRAEDLVSWFDPESDGRELVLANRNSARHGLGYDPVPSQGDPLESPVPIQVADCDCVIRVVNNCFAQPICLFLSLGSGACPLRSLEQPFAAVSSAPDFSSATDLGGRLRLHFSDTSAGRYYLDLWAEHGAEIMALTQAHPRLYWQRATSFASFAPALTGLVEGRGSQYTFTPELIRQAHEVWSAWRELGSPALRLAITQELERLDQFQVFAGQNFDQWFAGLSVGSAGSQLLRNGFE